MKLHRHTSHEMRTHKWPQFLPDCVEHDDRYVMNEFILYKLQKQLKAKKNPKMPDQAHANGLQWHDIP